MNLLVLGVWNGDTLLGCQHFQKQMHSTRKDVFILQTQNNFATFKPAYTDDAIHADLHLLASLQHLVQTQINYLHTCLQLKQPKQPLHAFNQSSFKRWFICSATARSRCQSSRLNQPELTGRYKINTITSADHCFHSFDKVNVFCYHPRAVIIELNELYGLTSTNV